jgi:hypothetical protein
LCEEVAISAVELDSVVACPLKIFSGVCEAINDLVDFFGGCCAWLGEFHAHDVALGSQYRYFRSSGLKTHLQAGHQKQRLGSFGFCSRLVDQGG